MSGKNYVQNEDLLIEIWKYQATGKISNYFGGMILSIAENLSRHGSFRGYSKLWLEDMRMNGVLTVLKYIHNFDCMRSAKPNPFAYITMLIRNSFLTSIKRDKKQVGIREDLQERITDEHTKDFLEQGCIDYSILADKDAINYRKPKKKKRNGS